MKVKYIAMLAAVSLLSIGVVSCSQGADTTSPNTGVEEADPCAGKNPCAGEDPCAGKNPCAGKDPCAGETK